MMTDDEIIAVVQAHKEGKQIQSRNNDTYCPWMDDDGMSWDFQHLDYQVNPEPRKPREWTVVVAPDKQISSYRPAEANEAFQWEVIRVREVIE